MNPMLIGGLLGGGLGLLKHGDDKRAAKADRKVQAAKARFSPWTGMTPTDVQQPSLFGNLLSGGTAGLMMGQAVDNQAMRKALMGAGAADQVSLLEPVPKGPYVPSDVAVGVPNDAFNYWYGGPWGNIGMA